LSISGERSLPLPYRRERQFPFSSQEQVTVCFLLLVAGAIGAGAIIGGRISVYTDLGFILLLGLPHGALDAELARHRLIGRWRQGWFAVFAMPYLFLSAAVLFSWHFFPVITLGLFLAISVVHFGEGRRLSGWQVIAKGGAPLALPILFHPAATIALLSIFAQAPLGIFALWLRIAACVWLFFYGAVIFQALTGRASGLWQELVLLTLLYAVFPPLTALALYFVCYHSPGHVQALIADKANAPRIASIREAILFSTPITILTLLLGAALWPFYHGPVSVRLTALTFQGLAALTLPHMLLNQQLYKNKNTN
jgi:Brp/Blh family beta-carotene 15,15'-monooxygenase